MGSKEIHNIFVSSDSRDTNLYPNGNSYTLHLTTPIKEIRKVELLHASIPNTLYNITNGSAVITITIIDFVSPLPDPKTITIPEGFFSASGIQTEINDLIGTFGGVAVKYLLYEGKFIFYSKTASFKFTINSEELAKILGFTNKTEYTSTPPADSHLYIGHPSYKNWIKSTYILNINLYVGVFLDIQEFRTSFNQSAVALNAGDNTYSSENISRTFGLIPMDVPGGQIKRFKKNTDYDFEVTYPYPIPRLDRLTITWTDKNGKLLNFNSLDDNSFLLRLHTERKSAC